MLFVSFLSPEIMCTSMSAQVPHILRTTWSSLLETEAALHSSTGPTKCFWNAQHMINNWQLKKRGYLIRFSHTEALLKKKKNIKRPFFLPCTNGPKYSFPHFHHRQHHNYFLGNHYDHTIRWLHYTLNCNFPLWKLKELRVKAFSILQEGGEGALSSGR